MTNERKQRILCLITDENGEYYYNGPLDGIWGAESQRAAERFLKDFTGENVADNNVGGKTDAGVEDSSVTGTFWDEIEYFTREEFRCQCKGKYCNGFPVEPQEEMVRTVNEIRRRLGVPVSIVTAGGSGVRCPVHNTNVGGVANSLHLTGNAADLHSSKSPEEMKRVAEEVMGNTGEIGLYNWGIHVGIGKYSRFNG